MRMPWNRNNTSTGLIATLIGLGCAAGVVAGMVLAPQAGSKTRSWLRGLGGRITQRGLRGVERAKEMASKKVARMPVASAG